MSHQDAIEKNFVTIQGVLRELDSNNKLMKLKGAGHFSLSPANASKEVSQDVLGEYQAFVQSCIAYPDTMKLAYPVIELCDEAAEVAEKLSLDLCKNSGMLAGRVKKVLRGDATLASRRELILQELGDVMFPLAALLTELGSTFEEVISLNTAKLKRRKEAGTIKGDGDKR